MQKALQVFSSKVKFHTIHQNSYLGSLEKGCTGSDVGLRECQFCKGTQQLIRNAYTAHYWIDCACGITLHSCHLDKHGAALCDMSGRDYDEQGSQEKFRTLEACQEAHKAAFLHVINKWDSLGQ